MNNQSSKGEQFAREARTVYFYGGPFICRHFTLMRGETFLTGNVEAWAGGEIGEE